MDRVRAPCSQTLLRFSEIILSPNGVRRGSKNERRNRRIRRSAREPNGAALNRNDRRPPSLLLLEQKTTPPTGARSSEAVNPRSSFVWPRGKIRTGLADSGRFRSAFYRQGPALGFLLLFFFSCSLVTVGCAGPVTTGKSYVHGVIVVLRRRFNTTKVR